MKSHEPHGLFRAPLLILLAILLLPSTVMGQADEEQPGSELGAEVEDTTPAAPANPDILGEALQQLKATRDDLGIHPNSTWTRFPQPGQIPHILPFFEGTYSEPLRLYDLARTLGNTVERYLAPGAMDAEPQSLHKLVYYMVVDKQGSGFRDYSVNLPQSDMSLMQALEMIWARAEGSLEMRAFGKVVRSREDLQTAVDALPVELQKPLAQLTVSLMDAMDWRQRAMRHVPQQSIATTWLELQHIQNQDDYQMHLDDVARFLDPISLAYANMKSVQAAQDARGALTVALKDMPQKRRKALKEIRFAYDTPWGWVVVGGTENDTHDKNDVLWLVDLGGNDTYKGRVAASTQRAPLSICIDLAGNDLWSASDNVPTQGAGVFGAGVLVDVEGDDVYEATSMAQGFGVFGLGLLLDENGDDRYTVQSSGQGCGLFGAGLCLDVQGNDQYDILEYGQGFGGVGGGIGILADHQGKDHYKAQPYVDGSGSGVVRTSNAQGVGRGRRGDGADGHSWAGGLGAIIDIQGRDTYESGNWSLGAGYWFWTGVAYDAEGEDLYRSVYFTQAAAAHYANGVLVDESGNDQHVLYETAGAAFAFGWDYANALFVNKAGNDRYEANVTSFGRADIRSTALFVDLAGNDRYQLGVGQKGFGAADFRDNYRVPDLIAPYNSEAKSFGLFLDVGGADEYRVWDNEKRQASPAEGWGEGLTWQIPRPGDNGYGYNNHGLGWDVSAGQIPEFFRFDGPVGEENE